jgi:SAM-dependent methyltransferase
MSAYEEDLAYVHVESTSHASGAAAGLIEALRGAGIEDGLVVDLGCGDGGWCAHLAEAGYGALGIDYSPAFIRRARGRGSSARFEVGSFMDVELPRCNAVTALGEVFNYRFDAQNTWPQLVGLFERIFTALAPGGLLIFDVAGPGRCPTPKQLFHGGDDWMVLVDTVEDAVAATLTRKITTFRRVGDLYRRADEVHHLQLYRPDALCEALTNIGFEPQVVSKYGDYLIPFAGCFGVVANKPNLASS